MEKRIQAFIKTGDFIRTFLAGEKGIKFQILDELIDTCYQYNGWFNRPNVLKALEGISLMLTEKDLRAFSKEIKPTKSPKTVAVIMAGNIPAVGFHDFLCVLLSGHKILVKLSSDDKWLIPYFAALLIDLEPSLKDQISFTEGKLEKFDAVIATGSDNSARYFNYYFGKYPNIIRKNRTSVAILSGTETKEDLTLLGHDIFDYYGLGCRNVSKVYIPKGYKLDTVFEGLFSFGYVIENKKYGNNYEYNRAVYLLNKEPFLDNNFVLMKQSTELHSPVGVLYYEEYENTEELAGKITLLKDELQCIVSGIKMPFETLAFGTTQCPDIFTFSDNINTVAFLNNLA